MNFTPPGVAGRGYILDSDASGAIRELNQRTPAVGGPTVVSGTPTNPTGSPQSFAFVGSDPDGYSNIYRVYFLINSNATIPQYSCHGFYDRPSNAFYLYNDALTVPLGPLTPGSSGTLANSQCQINGNSSAPAVGSGNNLTVNINMSLLGSYALAPQSAYLWVKDAELNDTGWVQTGTWNPPGGGPAVVSGTPANPAGSPQSFAFVGSDPDGYSNIYRVYFLMNSNATIPPYSCHGFYDRPSNAFYLYNDAVTVALGPLTPGSSGTLANSQCQINGNSSAPAAGSGNNLTVNINMSLLGSYALAAQNVYVWVKDAQNNDTGWVQSGTWNPPAGSQPPSIPSVSPNTSLTTAQTFTVTARDTDGPNNIYRLYFQVGPDATVTPNGCHGFYDRPSHTLFLYSDAMTLTGPITPGTASTLSNSQCTVLANSTSIVSSSGTDFVLSIGLAVQGAYSQLYRKVYFWAKDNQGNDSGWDSLGVSWTATFNAFRNCVTATTAATCTLPPATHTISQTIPLTRSNVTVRGGGSLRTDTKLLRDANFTSPLIQVDATGSLTNVVIENLTVCGGSGLPYRVAGTIICTNQRQRQSKIEV